MKNIKYIGVFLCALFLFSACEKETEGISGTIYFELLGEETTLVTLGTSYQEAGYKVTYRGQEVTKEIEVSGTVDAQAVGLYPIEYSYVNQDGVKTTKVRTVIVSDPTVTVNIAGDYLTIDGTMVGNTKYPGFKVTIKKIASGFFSVSDFFGGFYAQRAGYGAIAACSGYIQTKNDNTITFLSSSIIGAWGDTISGLSNTSYDPETGIISWGAVYPGAGATFTVVLNKK